MHENYHRYKITVEYLGTGIAGWQRQQNAITVQELLETAIYMATNERVVVFGSGRTDSGVHATGQVAHFDLKVQKDPHKLAYSINHFLKQCTVAIVDCIEVSNEFHARFSAIMRHYLYKITNRSGKTVIDDNRTWWIRHSLNIEDMIIAAKYLEGRHDFSSFRASHCQATSPIRTIDRIEILKHDDQIHIHCAAKSFLHHMVRNIVGSLVMVGLGKWSSDDMKRVLDARSRIVAGAMAPASGLYFSKVEY